MKDAYKQTRFVMGVFQVVNTADGKKLTDSSMDIPAKWKRHKMELRFGTHRNKALQRDWKLGRNGFFLRNCIGAGATGGRNATQLLSAGIKNTQGLNPG